MMQSIQVKCLLDRFWDARLLGWAGAEAYGTLIDISTQTAEDNSGKLIPVGIVLLEDNTFQSVPMEFIEKIEN